MTLDGEEVVSLLPIQAMNYVRAGVATSVAQAQDTLLAFEMALVAYRADVDHLLPFQAMNDVWEDVPTAVAQAQDALLAFQMALVASRAKEDHLNDLLYPQRIGRIPSSCDHEGNLAICILRLLFFAFLPYSHH